MKKSSNELLEDLYNVGITKAVSYLPLDTLIRLCHTTVDKIIDYAHEKNLKYKVFNPNECNIWSGAIYLYDENLLKVILSEYQKAFSYANVPHDNCDGYIKHIAQNTVRSEDYPDVYIAVGKTFNDKRFREMAPAK